MKRLNAIVRTLRAMCTTVLTASGHAIAYGISLPGRAVRAIERAIARAVRAIGRATSAAVRWVGLGVRRVTAAFYDLLRQLGLDFWHFMKMIGRGLRWLLMLPVQAVRAVWRALEWCGRQLSWVILKIGGPVIKPIRRMFAKKAKQEILGVATTPDHKSHWELIALLIGTTLLVAAAAVVGTGHSSSVMQATGADKLLAQLTPQAIINRLATYSPAKLMVVFSMLLLFLALVWFWLKMARDSFRRNYESATERTKWQLITVGLFIPGAIAYFFTRYNHWTLRQFVGHHFVSVMITGTALVVATSTYGTLAYFNQKASAQTTATPNSNVPNFNVDPKTRTQLLNRTQYGVPLNGSTLGGRTDPFAPVPGLQPAASPSPNPSASPSPAATPQVAQ